MGHKLYVGNLPTAATTGYLEEAFSSCGLVESVKIITDKGTGQGKGFGFVEMSTQTEAQSVINKFDGAVYEGKQMKISEAKPMQKHMNKEH